MCRECRGRRRHSEVGRRDPKELRHIDSPRGSLATAAQSRDSMRLVSELADPLPDDIGALRALLRSAVAERDRLAEENGRLEVENERLAQLLAQLRRAQFGRSSEKLDPDQLQLTLEDIEQAVAHIAAAQEQRNPPLKAERSRRRAEARPSLPPHLPRVDVVIPPEEASCPCCGGAMHVIGEDSSERLDVVPAQYQVIVTRRPKYGCRACEGAVVQAPAPKRLIEGGLPTEALVAQVLVNKYAWHLPLYRQAQMLMSQGIDIDRSTLASWVGHAAAELAPLADRLRELLLASAKIAVDETPAPVLDPGRGRTKTGYFWAISRDDRPWGGSDPPGVVYTYAPGRSAALGLEPLARYRGIVQCDGYAAYKQMADPRRRANAVTLAFCWAHLRRKFYDIAKGGAAPIAAEALQRIAALYAIEDEIRGRSPEARRAVRQTESRPLVEALKAWFEQQLGRVSGKSVIAQAFRYGLNHWDGLARFIDDGRIELDTNSVERSMRPIALNRKNALFAGHDEGAANWACIASLIETAKLNGRDPQAYIADTLTKLVNLWPASRLDELLPWTWSAAR
jgi:transposase